MHRIVSVRRYRVFLSYPNFALWIAAPDSRGGSTGGGIAASEPVKWPWRGFGFGIQPQVGLRNRLLRRSQERLCFPD
jgi:hypothetical protein